jgi:glycosyltransferase involved in cell wall biosynthesis
MKITILQGAFFPVPPLLGGAIEKAWEALGKEFAKLGHEVTHISRKFEALPERSKDGKVEHIRVRGANACSNPILLKLKELPYVLRARKHLPKADVLVTHTFWAPLLYPKDKYGKLYVHVGRYPKGQMGLYKKATVFQAPTQAIAQSIRNQSSNLADKISVQPYPLSLPVPSEIPFENKEKTILYVGRIHPEKGIGELMQAWQKLETDLKNGWRLKVLGPWRQEQGGAGAQYLKTLKNLISGDMEIVDPIFDPLKLHQEYLKARIFAYPSLAEKGETFGLSALEAMSAGCVPLLSKLECFQDFSSDRSNAIFFDHRASNRVEELTQMLSSTLANEEQLPSLSKVALMTARKYEITQVAQRYIDDFSSIL